MMQPTVYAFFDFDGTITRHDSFITFGRHALGRLRLALCIAAASPWLALWKLGVISNSAAKGKLFSIMFRGMPLQRFEQLGRSFASVIDSDLRPQTIDLIKKHRQQGHKVVIVSASIGAWIRPWAQSRGIDFVLSTEADSDKCGRLTGHFSTLNCHGHEKARRITEAFPDADAAETYAYGDSSGDDAMLAFAKHPTKIK